MTSKKKKSPKKVVPNKKDSSPKKKSETTDELLPFQEVSQDFDVLEQSEHEAESPLSSADSLDEDEQTD